MSHVFADTVRCVGKMRDDPTATWKDKIKLYSENNYFKDMNRIDGMPTEFEWFPGITTLGLLEKIQSLMRDLQCEPEHFKGRIIFMSMYNDMTWQEKGNKETCEYNSKTIADSVRKVPRGRWSFLGPGSEKKWYGTYSDDPDGSRDKIAQQMMVNFSESSHPIFRASSAFERRELTSCFSARLFLQISSVSTEQKQICARNYPKILRLLGNLKHLIVWKRWNFYSLIHCWLPYRRTATGKPGARLSANSNNCPMTTSYPNYALTMV